MASFQFRLQPLLDLRRRQREAAEARLSELAASRAALVNRRLDLKRQDVEARQALAESGAPSAADFQSVAHYSAYVTEACLTIRSELERCDAEIAAQRQVVCERTRDEELIWKLRQEDFEAWKRAEEAELEALAADSYIASWNRRRDRSRRLETLP